MLTVVASAGARTCSGSRISRPEEAEAILDPCGGRCARTPKQPLFSLARTLGLYFLEALDAHTCLVLGSDGRISAGTGARAQPEELQLLARASRCQTRPPRSSSRAYLDVLGRAGRTSHAGARGVGGMGRRSR